ncbi:hypothetical protein MHBO_002340 [Bonamia ostreae]|uniref:Uncharacterized protein n=1 Tax=Bonamia ostreae TaxID=126728 RepID=A0ABV2AM42_9EUKA
MILNKNVEFIGTKSFFCFYILLIAITRILLWYMPSSEKYGWTLVGVLHSIITFFMLHWSKGTPSLEDQGKFEDLTFWEQIDYGVQYTKTRKLLTLVPILIFLLATYETDWNKIYLFVNFSILAVLLVAKLPLMYHVRLFGINK